MKKTWKIMLGGLMLGAVLLAPTRVNAALNDHVRFSSNDLLDDFMSDFHQDYAESKKREEIDALSVQYESGAMTDEEYDAEVTAVELKWEEKTAFVYEYGIFPKEYVASVEEVSPDWSDKYTSLNGIEHATGLVRLTGEGGTTKDLRPLRVLDKLETVGLEVSNQINLYDLKNAENLKELNLRTSGYGNYEDEEEQMQYSQAVLMDITALSGLDRLERISIRTKGVLPTITLKRGTTSYQLYDPVVPSSQFDGEAINYFSDISSDEWLEWQNLTGNEEFLTFSWDITKGRNTYYGDAQIPIRWK